MFSSALRQVSGAGFAQNITRNIIPVAPVAIQQRSISKSSEKDTIAKEQAAPSPPKVNGLKHKKNFRWVEKDK